MAENKDNKGPRHGEQPKPSRPAEKPSKPLSEEHKHGTRDGWKEDKANTITDWDKPKK